MIESLLFGGREFNFPSQFIAIAGDNGSGKSRFLRALREKRSSKAIDHAMERLAKLGE
jgi:ABC-type phosphate/phosphonate transport system ATPase subunit